MWWLIKPYMCTLSHKIYSMSLVNYLNDTRGWFGGKLCPSGSGAPVWKHSFLWNKNSFLGKS